MDQSNSLKIGIQKKCQHTESMARIPFSLKGPWNSPLYRSTGDSFFLELNDFTEIGKDDIQELIQYASS